VRRLLRGREESLLAALIITLVLLGLVALVPAIARRMAAAPTATPAPTPTITPPPPAILLPDERDHALEGVMTLANERSFGTAFLVDGSGDFVTASSVIDGAAALRLIDNTGGTHQVRLLGIDRTLGVAMVRASTDGSALAVADSSTTSVKDPIVLLASPKVQNLSSSSPGTVTAVATTQWSLAVDDLPGNLGGPVVGPGAKVLAVLAAPGTGVPWNAIAPDIKQWTAEKGTLLPLAPFPASLILRGSDSTTTPTSAASLQAVSPARVSASQTVIVSLQGTGFVGGPALAVRFLPLSGSSGTFNGLIPTLVNASTVTVKVPAGQLVQDYVIELINGDGTMIPSRIAFTVTP
jgi:hypothetical protein